VLHGWYAEAQAECIPPELNVAPLFPYGYHLLADLRLRWPRPIVQRV
jgi:hypothetical protein